MAPRRLFVFEHRNPEYVNYRIKQYSGVSFALSNKRITYYAVHTMFFDFYNRNLNFAAPTYCPKTTQKSPDS